MVGCIDSLREPNGIGLLGLAEANYDHVCLRKPLLLLYPRLLQLLLQPVLWPCLFLQPLHGLLQLWLDASGGDWIADGEFRLLQLQTGGGCEARCQFTADSTA